MLVNISTTQTIKLPSRDQYLKLLENYIEEGSDSLNFRIRFCERYESIKKMADLLKSNRVLLSPDENSLDFGDLLSEIDSCCKAYSDDPEPYRNKFEIGDVEFRTSIEKIYLKIQKFLKTNESNLMVEPESLSTLKAKLKFELKEELLIELGKESEIGNSTLEFSKDFSKVLLVERSYQVLFLVSLVASGFLLVNLF